MLERCGRQANYNLVLCHVAGYNTICPVQSVNIKTKYEIQLRCYAVRRGIKEGILRAVMHISYALNKQKICLRFTSMPT
jgi:hypothetical protein